MTDLHHNITIDAPPRKVYAALATRKGLRGWWTADVKADSKPGGKAEFGFEDGATVIRMTIDALEPGKRVRWTCNGDPPQWRGTKLDWRISRRDGATVLDFVQRGFRAMTPFVASCNSTWGELMFRLKSYAEGNAPGPHWTE